MHRFDWRTGIEVLEEEECWRLIEPGGVGRLAIAIKGRPDIFPVNYLCVDQTIIVNTAPGTKLAAAVLGQAVAFEVDSLDADHHLGWSVVLQGPAVEVTRLDDLLEIEELEIETWAEGEKLRYMQITAESITGRRLPVSAPTDSTR